jgi:hypothetical protein
MTAPVTIALLPVVAAAAVKLSNKPALASLFAVLATAACFSALWSIAPQSTDIFSKIVHNQLALSEIPQYAARGGNRKFPLSSPDDAQSVPKRRGRGSGSLLVLAICAEPTTTMFIFIICFRSSHRRRTS